MRRIDERLTAACEAASADRVHRALAHGARCGPDSKALHAAASRLQECVSSLLGRGADPNNHAGLNYAPLILAAEGGRAEAARELLRAGARPDDIDGSTGKTALILASEHGHLSVAEELLRYGANPLAVGPDGLCSEAMALSAGHHEVAALIRRWAEPIRVSQAIELVAGPGRKTHSPTRRI